MSVSVGIEFEAVIGIKKNNPSAKVPQLSDVVDAIKSSGRSASLYLPSTARTTPDFTVWNVTVDATISELTSGSDSSENAFNDRNGVEITTPTFFPAGPSWETEVRAVLDHLRDTFVEKDYLWKANSSTGLHVHVGSVEEGKSIPFTLEQARKVAKFVVKFEDIIDQMHSPKRVIDNDNIESNRRNALLEPLSLAKIFEMLDQCSTTEEIARIVNYAGQGPTQYDGYTDSKFFKVNFTSLAKYGTVEFRQHAGTVDASITVRWVKIVLSVVSYATRATDAEILGLEESRKVFNQVVSGSL